jgi:hypothetical protein
MFTKEMLTKEMLQKKCYKRHVCNCVQMFAIVYKCLQLCTNVCNCVQMFAIVYKCLQMFQIVFSDAIDFGVGHQNCGVAGPRNFCGLRQKLKSVSGMTQKKKKVLRRHWPCVSSCYKQNSSTRIVNDLRCSDAER